MRIGQEYLGISARLRWVGDSINPIGAGLFTRAVM